MIVITARCPNGHTQAERIGGVDLEWGEIFAGLMDGTSELYKPTRPADDPTSTIGKCGICGAQITCTVEEEEPS